MRSQMRQHGHTGDRLHYQSSQRIIQGMAMRQWLSARAIGRCGAGDYEPAAEELFRKLIPVGKHTGVGRLRSHTSGMA